MISPGWRSSSLPQFGHKRGLTSKILWISRAQLALAFAFPLIFSICIGLSLHAASSFFFSFLASIGATINPIIKRDGFVGGRDMPCQEGHKLQYIVMGLFGRRSFLLFLINRYRVLFGIELDSLNGESSPAHIPGNFFNAIPIGSIDFLLTMNLETRIMILKKYGKTRVLHPLNAKYEDIELSKNTEYRIIGIVVEKKKKYR